MSLAVWLTMSLCVTVPTDEDTIPAPGWFQLVGDAALNWQLSAIDSNRYEISSRGIAEANPYRILVLFSKASSAYDIAVSQILDVFNDKKLAAVFALRNFGGDRELGLSMLAPVRDGAFDLVYSVGSGSTSFAVEHLEGETTPVVTVCSKDPVLMGQVAGYSGSQSNIAFTSLDIPVRIQMAYLNRLVPDLNNIVVLYARDNTSAVRTQVIPLGEFGQREGLHIIDVAIEDQDRAREELAQKLPLEVARIIELDPARRESVLWITGSTSVFREIETINRYADGIPVVSAIRNVVQAGEASAMLSIGVSFENNAQIAAIYGYKVLTDKARPGTLPVGIVTPPDLAINFLKVREIGQRIPFSFFESASYVYDAEGELVRARGQRIARRQP